MTSWIVVAYFLMFLKGNVAVEDISYIYLLSNLIGGIILVSRLHLDYGKISLGPLVYIVVNVSLPLNTVLFITPLILITFFLSPFFTGILVALLILFEYLTLWQASSASRQVKIR